MRPSSTCQLYLSRNPARSLQGKQEAPWGTHPGKKADPGTETAGVQGHGGTHWNPVELGPQEQTRGFIWVLLLTVQLESLDLPANAKYPTSCNNIFLCLNSQEQILSFAVAL